MQINKFKIMRLKKQIFLSAPFIRFAFTLAEVLIVVGIIGIIAEMTIPTIIQSTHNAQYTLGLKKAYSELGGVFNQIQSEYNCLGDLACTGLFGTTTTNDTTGAVLASYFKVIKTCLTAADGQGCWPSSTSSYYDRNASPVNLDSSAGGPDYRFTTADGMSFLFGNYSDNCTSNKGSGPLASSVCGFIYVDVNGFSSPNRLGRDTFMLRIARNGNVYLGGSLYDASPYTTSCNTSTVGIYCGGKIAAEDWKMNY